MSRIKEPTRREGGETARRRVPFCAFCQTRRQCDQRGSRASAGAAWETGKSTWMISAANGWIRWFFLKPIESRAGTIISSRVSVFVPGVQ